MPREQKLETSNPSYAAYIREAFGNGYRLTDKNWNKLRSGTFYNPAHHAAEITPSKVMMFHAEDDALYSLRAGQTLCPAHRRPNYRSCAAVATLHTEFIVQKYWPQIKMCLWLLRSDASIGLTLHRADA